uniref:Glycosyltransferase n=1 Tax=Epimedium koreanum TaxID=63351 RepID=A0A8B0H812_9MAGN|nr:flavonoid 3-O-galactosyltransferase [Epimedium koreanum]
MGTNQQPHVAAFAFPFSSHPAQVLNVIRKASTAAPDVTFSFFSTAKSISTLFGSKPEEGNIKGYVISDGLPENYVFTGNPLEPIGLFLKSAADIFRKGVEVAVSETNKKITCVVSDGFLWFAGQIAQELGVPWVPIWASGLSSLSMHFYTDLIREKFGVPPTGKENSKIDFIPGMSEMQVGDFPEEVIGPNIDTGFAQMMHRTGKELPHASAVAINSFDELESPFLKDLQSKFKLCLPIGPLTFLSPPSSDPTNGPTGCISWLDSHEQETVAYISFGTFATPPPNELAALAEAVEDSNTPFLWVLKEAEKVHLPDGFLNRTSERGMVVPWSPQIKVLEHPSIGVFITHCGWNSVLEGIMCGVPLIFRPFLGDHTLIGRLVSDVWKIGIKAHGGIFTKDDVLNALDLIFAKEEGKKIRENVQALKQHGKEAFEPTGSTTKNFNTLVQIITSC